MGVVADVIYRRKAYYECEVDYQKGCPVRRKQVSRCFQSLLLHVNIGCLKYFFTGSTVYQTSYYIYSGCARLSRLQGSAAIMRYFYRPDIVCPIFTRMVLLISA